MHRNVHFFTRQAAREAKAARVALTEAARERHQALAALYAQQAEQLQQVAKRG